MFDAISTEKHDELDALLAALGLDINVGNAKGFNYLQHAALNGLM